MRVKLTDLLTPEFLTTLTEVAKRYGWSGDYMEIWGFVEDCFEKAGLPCPDLKPYPVEDEE